MPTLLPRFTVIGACGWRGDTSIAKRVEYDLYYLRNWSLTFDLQIITMALLHMFNSKNAY